MCFVDIEKAFESVRKEGETVARDNAESGNESL